MKWTYFEKHLDGIPYHLWTHSSLLNLTGPHVTLDAETNKYTADESPNTICILVGPKDKNIVDPKYYIIHVADYPELRDLPMVTVSPAKLACIAVRGYTIPGLELEHLDHHHNCITHVHHHFTTMGINQQRKVDQVPPHELKVRDEHGRFTKTLRTHVPATCNHGPVSTAKDWKDIRKRIVYEKLIQTALPRIKMAPFWWLHWLTGVGPTWL